MATGTVVPKSPINRGGNVDVVDDLSTQWVKCKRLSVLGDADCNSIVQRKPLVWTALTLANAWTNIGAPYANAGFRIEPLYGVVRLRGLLHGGASATAAFTLPAPARPSVQVGLASANSNAGAGVLVITTAGVATAYFGGALSSFALDGMTFPLR